LWKNLTKKGLFKFGGAPDIQGPAVPKPRHRRPLSLPTRLTMSVALIGSLVTVTSNIQHHCSRSEAPESRSHVFGSNLPIFTLDTTENAVLSHPSVQSAALGVLSFEQEKASSFCSQVILLFIFCSDDMTSFSAS
jgi:hypothetical protein